MCSFTISVSAAVFAAVSVSVSVSVSLSVSLSVSVPAAVFAAVTIPVCAPEILKSQCPSILYYTMSLSEELFRFLASCACVDIRVASSVGRNGRRGTPLE